jgi:hypothetical protein
VVDVSALKASLRKPVEDHGLTEIARNLGMARTLLHVEMRAFVWNGYGIGQF